MDLTAHAGSRLQVSELARSLCVLVAREVIVVPEAVATPWWYGLEEGGGCQEEACAYVGVLDRGRRNSMHVRTHAHVH